MPRRDEAPAAARPRRRVNNKVTRALYDLTGQQFEIEVAGKAYAVDAGKRPGANWFTLDSVRYDLNLAVFQSLPTLEVRPQVTAGPSKAELLSFHSRSFALKHARPWRNEAGQVLENLWDLPDDLTTVFADRSSSVPTLRLGKVNEPAKADDPEVTSPQWVTTIAVQLDRVYSPRGGGGSNAAPLANVFGVRSTGDRSLRQVEAVLRRLRSSADSVTAVLRLALLRDDVRELPGAAEQVRIFRTNLSTDPNPPELRGTSVRVAGDGGAVAHLSAAKDFLVLLRDCMVVNSGGYYLYTPGDLSSVFAGQNPGRVTLLVLFTANVPTGDAGFNGVRLSTTIDPAGESLPYFTVTGVDRVEAQAEPGSLSLVLSRKNPFNRYRTPDFLVRTGRSANNEVSRQELVKGLASVGITVGSPEFEQAMREAGDELATLEANYATVQAAIVGSRAFAPSGDEVLPVGPDKPVTPPGGAVDDEWPYRLALPVNRYVRERPGGPPLGRNAGPYSGVGESVTVAVRFRDVFGNRLDGWEESREFRIGYLDRLIGAEQWPYVRWGFDFTAAGKLRVTAAFEPPPKRKRKTSDKVDLSKAKEVFNRVLAQLTGPGVQTVITTSLAGSRSWRVDFVDFVEEVLRKIDEKQPSVTWASADLPVNPELPSGYWTSRELWVAVCITRDLAMMDERVTVRDAAGQYVYPETFSVFHPIEPALAAGTARTKATDPSPISQFADRFEKGFRALKLAATKSADDRPPNLHFLPRTLLAVRFGSPALFAPRPISNTLREATLDRNGEKLLFDNLDLDVEMGGFLAAVERILAPDYAGPACSADEAAFASVVSGKQRLAYWLKEELVIPVSADDASAKQESRLAAAKDAYYERLLASLTNAYGTDVIVQLLGMCMAGIPGDGPAPLLYGEFQDVKTSGRSARRSRGVAATTTTTTTAAGFDDLRLPECRIPLLVSGGPVTVPLGVKREGVHPAAEVRLRTLVTHAFEPRSSDDPRPDGTWLRLILPEVLDLTSSPLTAPLPLRRFPALPTLLGHRGPDSDGQNLLGTPRSSDVGRSKSAADLRHWFYEFEYQHLNIPQDQVNLGIRFNVGLAARAATVDPLAALTPALVAFRLEWPSLNERLASLRDGGPPGTVVKDVAKAVEYVVSALPLPSSGFRDRRTTDAEVTEWYAVRECMRSARKTRRPLLQERVVTLTRYPETRRSVASDVAVTPLSTDGATFDTKPLGENNEYRSLFYTEPADWPNWLRRRVRIGNLDMLVTENACAGLELTRNTGLLPGGKDPDPRFIYRTRYVSLPDPFTPFVKDDRPIPVAELGSGGGRRRKLAEHLGEMLHALLDVPDDHERTIRLAWSYAFLVNPSILDSRVRRPVEMTLPFEFTSKLLDSVVGQVARSLRDWAATSSPSRAGNFTFDFTVFSRSSGGNTPLWRLERLELPLSLITDL